MRLRQVLAGIAAVALSTAGLVAFGPTSSVGANPEPGIKPDFVLDPDGPMITREIKSTTIGAPVASAPANCRKDPVASNVCDAYRLKLNLSKDPDAENYVVIFLEYKEDRPPSVSAVFSVSPGGVPELDLKVYSDPKTTLPSGVVGGVSLTNPERVAFVAEQSEYDLVVKNDQGVSEGYTLRMFMSDEIFDSQFELLDEVQQRVDDEAPAPAPPADNDFSSSPSTPSDVVVEDPNQLSSLRPINDLGLDSRINGIGLGTTTNFDFGAQQVFGQRTQRAVSIADAPSGVSLLLLLLVLPMAVAVFGAFWLRRRRQALI